MSAVGDPQAGCGPFELNVEAVGRALFERSTPQDRLQRAVEILAEATWAHAAGAFCPHAGGFDLAAGVGWSLPSPHQLPRIGAVGSRPVRLRAVHELDGAPLLRDNGLVDGLLCDLVLAPTRVGVLGVFWRDPVGDTAAVAESVAALTVVIEGALRLRAAE